MILARKTLILLLLLPTFPINAHTYQWAVIGAGPAGIISTTILLEHIKTPKDILWLDPAFGVGRLGKYYGNVPSNLKAYRYTTFLSSCALFNQLQCSSFNAIRQYDQQDEPVLQLLIDPLQEITNYLQTQVQWHTSYRTCLRSRERIMEHKHPHYRLLCSQRNSCNRIPSQHLISLVHKKYC